MFHKSGRHFSPGRSLVVLFTCLISSCPALGDVRFVRSNAPGGGNGLSWATAYNNLQVALTAAGSNPSITELWVAAGTYKPAGPGGPRSATFQVRSGLALYGGFAGNEIALRERNVEVHVTILSGDLNGNDGTFTVPFPPPAFLDDNSYHVLRTTSANAATRIDGFTIEAGAAMPPPESSGGGAFVSGGSPVIENCTFRRNYASAEGGALRLDAISSPIVRSCVFNENRVLDSSTGGGAISVELGSPLIDRCQFDSNWAAPSGGPVGGGAIHAMDSQVSIMLSTFTSNYGFEGGGILLVGGQLDIQQCTFTANSARYGGALDSFDADVHMTDCSVRDSSGVEIGGGIILGRGSHVIRNTLFEKHVGCDGGSAIYASSASAQIENCLFIDNTAVLWGGPAIWNSNFDNHGAAVTIDNCFFFGNRAIGSFTPGGAVLSGQGCCGNPPAEARTIIRSSFFLSNSSTTDPVTGGAVHAQRPGLTTLCDVVFSNNSPEDYLAVQGAVISVASSCECVGDTNQTNAVDVDDLIAVILAWGACPDCPSQRCAADMAPWPKGNCAVDVDDLIAVILNWGACP